MDSQGSLGKKVFEEKHLEKMVDIVIPTAVHFTINKYNTVLISAKTTLRERWQEVSEENNRTAATSMYLATLDNGITKDVISSLDESGVRLVVLKEAKDTIYQQYQSVVSYEDLFQTISDINSSWSSKVISGDNVDEITDRFSNQKGKHRNNNYISEYYTSQINSFKNKKA